MMVMTAAVSRLVGDERPVFSGLFSGDSHFTFLLDGDFVGEGEGDSTMAGRRDMMMMVLRPWNFAARDDNAYLERMMKML